eukprot:403372114
MGWFLGLSIFMIIPLDIYTVKTNGEVDEFLVVWWYINYWLVFGLNWFILPFLMEYLSAADFTFKERMMRSIRNNVPMLVVYLVLFVVVVIILAVTKSGREALQNEGIVGCIIGLSLVFGLLSIVILLGYGLVKIPISYFKFSSNAKKLMYYQQKTAEFDSKYRVKLQKVQDMVNIGHMIKVKHEMEPHRKVILQDIEIFTQSMEDQNNLRIAYDPRNKLKLPKEFKGFIDYQRLVRLRNRFRYQSTDLLRIASFRRESIEKAILMQDIIDSQLRGDREIKSMFLKDRDNSQRSKIIKFLIYFWFVYLKPVGMILMSFICLSLSLASLIPLVYLVAATNYGLFQLKVSNIYALHKNKSTDPSCLLFSSIFVMRLAVPISYNFLQLTQMNDAAVYRVMGPVRYVKFLGEGFNQWVFPVCLVLMVILTAFNIYGRILNCIGLKQYAFDPDQAEERVEEGKFIIEKYRNEKFIYENKDSLVNDRNSSSSAISKEKVSLKDRLLIFKKKSSTSNDDSNIVSHQSSMSFPFDTKQNLMQDSQQETTRSSFFGINKRKSNSKGRQPSQTPKVTASQIDPNSLLLNNMNDPAINQSNSRNINGGRSNSSSVYSNNEEDEYEVIDDMNDYERGRDNSSSFRSDRSSANNNKKYQLSFKLDDDDEEERNNGLKKVFNRVFKRKNKQ